MRQLFKSLMPGDATDGCQDAKIAKWKPTKSTPMLLLLSKDSKALELKPNVFEVTKHFPNIPSSVTALKKTEDSNKLSQKIGNGVTRLFLMQSQELFVVTIWCHHDL